MYTPRNNFPQELANMQKMTPQKYFPVFARVRIQVPHAFAKKLIPQEFFPACIGFVPGGSLSAFSPFSREPQGHLRDADFQTSDKLE